MELSKICLIHQIFPQESFVCILFLKSTFGILSLFYLSMTLIYVSFLIIVLLVLSVLVNLIFVAATTIISNDIILLLFYLFSLLVIFKCSL